MLLLARQSSPASATSAQDRALPDDVVEQILSRTDGIPLFVEELTRSLLDSGLLRETPGSGLLDGALPSRAIPTTLQASLVARLDLLGPAKDVAMIGAAIGREFSHELIAAVSPLAPEDLDVALARLVASGLISRRGAPPVASYIFKHALADSLGDVRLQMAATLFLGTACFSTLELQQVEPLFVRALELLDRQPSFERFGLAGYPAVTVRGFLARIYAEQRRFEQGLAHGEEGIRIALAVDNPFSLTIAYWCLADLFVIRGEFAGAITRLERAREQLNTATALYREMGTRFWLERADAALDQLQSSTAFESHRQLRRDA